MSERRRPKKSRRLRHYVRRFTKSTEEEFVSHCPDAVLLAPAKICPTPDSDSSDHSSGMQFTDISDNRKIADAEVDDVERTGMIVPVAKSEKGPFKGIISIGRARDNDITLESRWISKTHSYIIPNETGEGFQVADANSKNGTFLNGSRLDPRKPAPLADGAQITFGTVDCTFYSADGLCDLVRQLAGDRDN